MKTYLAIFLVVVGCGVTSLRADDAAVKPANQSAREFVEQRMQQIDLDVALKQIEKISNELANAKTELMVAREMASTDQEKKDCQKMEAKVSALEKASDVLHGRALEIASYMDDQAKRALAANQTGK